MRKTSLETQILPQPKRLTGQQFVVFVVDNKSDALLRKYKRNLNISKVASFLFL